MFTKTKSYLHRLVVFLSILIVSITFVVNVQAQQIGTSNRVITRVGDAPLDQRPGGDFTFYCQGGPPWGDTCSMGQAGCGPTALAMIMSTLGVVMTPDRVNRIFIDEIPGAKASCSSGSDGVAAIDSSWFRGLGFSHRENVAPGGVFDFTAAKQALADGYYILGSSGAFPIVNCAGSGPDCVMGHIFVVDSIDASNRISIRDPNNCNYMPGNGAERTIHFYNGTEFPWLYAYPIIKS